MSWSTSSIIKYTLELVTEVFFFFFKELIPFKQCNYVNEALTLSLSSVREFSNSAFGTLGNSETDPPFVKTSDCQDFSFFNRHASCETPEGKWA